MRYGNNLCAERQRKERERDGEKKVRLRERDETRKEREREESKVGRLVESFSLKIPLNGITQLIHLVVLWIFVVTI